MTIKINKKIMSKSPSFKNMLYLDCISYFFTVIPAFLIWFISIVTFVKIDSYLAWFFLPLFSICLFCLLCFLIRLPLPRLIPGIIDLGLNPMSISWYCQNALNRSLLVSGIKPLILAMNWSRFLYFRSMGMNIAFRHNSSYQIIVNDMELVTISQDVTLAESVEISAHTFLGDKLVLREIVIKENSFIGKDTYLGPGTSIGSNCYIGMGNILFKKKIDNDTKIKNFEYRG